MSLHAILEILKVENHQEISEEAYDGQQAVNMIIQDVEENNGLFSSFDLILMDFQMPIMDGNEATSMIRNYLYSHNIKQPIICGCTGHMEESYIKRMIENGMNQVLSKPVQMDCLKKTLLKLKYL